MSDYYTILDWLPDSFTPDEKADYWKKVYPDDNDTALLIRAGFSMDEIRQHRMDKKAYAGIEEMKKEILANEDPSFTKLAASLGAEIAISEGMKSAGTAGGAAAMAAFGQVPPLTLLPDEIVGVPAGAAVGYVGGAVTGGATGSLVAQKIEGRDKVSWGRVAADSMLNLLPGTELKAGPKTLKTLSKVMSRNAIMSTATTGAVVSPMALAIESYIDTGVMPTKEQATKSMMAGALFGGGIGYTAKKGSRLLNRFAGKSEEEVNRLVRLGDSGAIDYIDAVTANVDPKNFLSPSQVTAEIVRMAKARGAPSKLVGPKATQAMIDAKNATMAGDELGGLLGKRIDERIMASQNPEELRGMVVDYISGDLDKLPSEFSDIADDASQARKWIREYQQELLDNHNSGQRPLPKALREKIEESMNKGDYVTRSYRFFEDPHFKPNNKDREAAIKSLMAGEKPMKRVEAEEYLTQLNARRASNPDDLYAFLESTSSGILRERKDLPPELRRYLGEYEMPGEKLASTMSKISRLAAYDKADSEVSRFLTDSGLLTKAKEGMAPNLVPIKLRRGTAKLDGEDLYGPPDVQLAINEIYGMAGDEVAENVAQKVIGDIFRTGVAVSKASKVLGNPPSYAVQLYSNMFNLVGMAMNPARGIGAGIKAGIGQFADSGIGKLPIIRRWATEMKGIPLDNFKRYKELGIVPDGLAFADMKAGLDGFLGRKVSKALDPFGKAYSVPDIAFRVSAFENYAQMLRRVAKGADEQKVESLAARMTNSTYQNYEYLNKSLKTLSKYGVIGQFASFTMELARNQYNQGRMIKRMLDGSLADEIAQETGVEVSKPRMVAEGVKRLAALGTVYAGTILGVERFNSENGVDSKRKEQAIRETLMPDYDANKPHAMAWDGENLEWFNTSYMVPHAQAASPVMAGFRGDSFGDSLHKSLSTFTEDLVGEGNFFMNSLSQALNNQSFKTGEPISSKGDKFSRAVDQAAWFLKDIGQPGLVREMEKARINPTSTTVMRQAGIRKNHSNWKDAFRFKAKDMKDTLNSSAKNLAYERSRLEAGRATPEEFNEKFKAINDTYVANSETLVKHVNNLRVLGKSDDHILTAMMEFGIGTERALNAMDGIVKPLDPQKKPSINEQYDAMMEGKSLQEKIKTVYDVAKAEPFKAKYFRDILKQDEIDTRLGVTTRDSAIRRLSSRDGTRAEFIVREMKKSQNPDAVLQNYVRKNIVSPEVMVQIKALMQKN